MSWVAVAVGGATLVGGYMQSKGAKDAAKASAGGADRSAQVQWDMFNRATQLNEPFRQGGLAGLQEYMSFLGLPTSSVMNASSAQSSAMAPSGAIEWFDWSRPTPVADPESYRNDPLYKQAWDEVWAHHNGRFDRTSDRQAIANHLQMIYDRKRAEQQAAQPAAATSTGGGAALTAQQITDKLRATPGYQFAFNEGQRALESSAAASGGLFSGKAGKALTQYGQGMADQQYGTHLNRLASLAGLGQTATAQNNQMGMQTAGNVGNALQNAGNARASGIANSANVWGSALGQIGGIAGYAWGNRGGSTGASAPGWWGSGGWGGI